MNFKDQVAIVTGASSGIGRATAEALADRGATVVGVARRRAELETLASECKARAGEGDFIAGDLGERDFAVHCVEETVARHGRVDILVNNAGIPCHRDIYAISLDDAEAVMRVNFLSCLWTTLSVIPPMLLQEGGTIVNVSSIASKVVPTHETLYAASKMAMNGLSEGLWNDLAGSGIHVALVHPGPIDTEIWGKIEDHAGYQGRLYPADDVARGIVDVIEKRRHETVLPRWNFMLSVARALRHLAPRLLRAGTARTDPVNPAALARARERAGRR